MRAGRILECLALNVIDNPVIEQIRISTAGPLVVLCGDRVYERKGKVELHRKSTRLPSLLFTVERAVWYPARTLVRLQLSRMKQRLRQNNARSAGFILASNRVSNGEAT